MPKLNQSEALGQIGEFGFIERIRRGCVVRPEGVVTAIGDDAAAFITPAGHLTLVTTDLLVEGIHFRRDKTPARDLGHKALAVNLSDIAAMGGTAREVFVSIAVPRSCSVGYLEDLYGGMKALAEAFDVNILGGDTTASGSDLVMNVCVVGSVLESRMLQRKTAVIGDRLLVTGFLGDSRAGLHLLMKEEERPAGKDFADLIQAHRQPFPHLRQGRFLGLQAGVHAAIDISDGLASDVAHMARASRAGVRLVETSLPLSPSLKRFCSDLRIDAAQFALIGGEDYVLLVAVAAERAGAVAAAYAREFGSPLYDIGEITAGGTLEMLGADGAVHHITAKGWDHFRGGVFAEAPS